MHINNYINVLKNFSDFKSRSGRAEFWYFVLFHIIILIALSFVEGTLGMGQTLSNIYSIVALVPYIAVGVRRMHDVGKSGFFLLIPIYNIILAATEGEKTDNAYGPVPTFVS